MTIRKPKASVAIESLESKTNTIKKKEKEKTSVVTCPESSIRKWKVSETIVPVMSEIERFSLKVVSESSVTNNSCGSLNETFEKNIHFNFQNSFGKSSSVESRNRKSSVSAAPLFRSISPFTYKKTNEKNNLKSTTNDVIFEMIEETQHSQINENVPPIQVIEETQPTPVIEEVIEETQPKPLIERLPKNFSVIRKKLTHINESQELDIDDVQLSSFEEEPSFKSPIPRQDLIDKIGKVESSQDLKSSRIAKQTAKQNIFKQCDTSVNFRFPVDIDGSQNTADNAKEKLITRKFQPAKLNNMPLNESVVQQSKLCDISKAYLHSQESSLISSPIEIEKLKSAVDLPGRISFNSKTNNQKLDPEGNTNIDENTNNKRFFKSSFHERRLEEIDRITNLNGEKSGKNSDIKITKKPKGKKNSKSIKKPAKKKNTRKKDSTKKKLPTKRKLQDYQDTITMLLTGNSDKEQIDKITIDESENSKFNQPIEKFRSAPEANEDDLFSFTPINTRKRKMRISKQTSKPGRKKSFEIFDLNSDISSPLPIRKSSISYKSRQSAVTGNEFVTNNTPLNDIILNFEYDLKQMKNIQLTMNSRLNQFKNILSNSF